ncbi:Cytochrome P450 71A9-like protein [Drosera capensis]
MGFAPYGEYWSEVSKIAILELFGMKRVKSFRFVRDKGITWFVGSAFGTQGEENTKYYGLLHEVQSLVGEVNLADYFPWLSWINKLNGVDERTEKTFTGLDKLSDKVIKEHRHPSSTVRPDEDGSKDFVGALLEDILIGGSVGSAAILEWTMAEIFRNPEIMKRAQEEVGNIAEGKQYVEESDLPKLHYLQMVLKESFRLHPPTPLLVPRVTTEDCVVMGFDIPAKTQVFINAKAIGLDSEC